MTTWHQLPNLTMLKQNKIKPQYTPHFKVPSQNVLKDCSIDSNNPFQNKYNCLTHVTFKFKKLIPLEP